MAERTTSTSCLGMRAIHTTALLIPEDTIKVALKVKVACEPYKSKGIVEYLLNGELGKSYAGVDGPCALF